MEWISIATSHSLSSGSYKGLCFGAFLLLDTIAGIPNNSYSIRWSIDHLLEYTYKSADCWLVLADLLLFPLRHGSFSDSKQVNNLVGHLSHTVILVPFHCWRLSHKTHHTNTANIRKVLLLPSLQWSFWLSSLFPRASDYHLDQIDIAEYEEELLYIYSL